MGKSIRHLKTMSLVTMSAGIGVYTNNVFHDVSQINCASRKEENTTQKYTFFVLESLEKIGVCCFHPA